MGKVGSGISKKWQLRVRTQLEMKACVERSDKAPGWSVCHVAGDRDCKGDWSQIGCHSEVLFSA